MSVSSAMYAAISGLQSMGTAMSVLSNNIANVNTVGFKAARTNFVDLISQRLPTAQGSNQVGRGVRVGSINQVFSQGAFMSSAQDSDLAIGGEGFFKVQDPVTGFDYYSRAGNFIFDSEGYMTLPTGHILQGWALDDNGQILNSTVPIRLGETTAPPQVTSRASYILNLDNEDESKTDGVPLSNRWDGSAAAEPIDAGAYTYQTSMRVYDSLGGGHDLTIYFDPSDTIDNKWDYIVTCDPTEDMRTFDREPAETDGSNTFMGTMFAGLLQRGTITFEPTDPITGTGGKIREITADRLVYDANDPTIQPNELNTAIGAIVNGVSATGPQTTTVATTTPGPGTYSGNVDKIFTVSIDTNQNLSTATIGTRESGTSLGLDVESSAGTYTGTTDQVYTIMIDNVVGDVGTGTYDIHYSTTGGPPWTDIIGASGMGPHAIGAEGATLTFTGDTTNVIGNGQQFTIDAEVADLEGPPYLTYSWTDGTTTVNNLPLDQGLGPYNLAEGVQFELEDLGTAPPRQIMYGSTFSINATANWELDDTNIDGYFTVDAAFLRDPGPTPNPNPLVGTPVYQTMEINFGANNINYTPGNNVSPWQLENMTTTQYAAPSSTVFQTQDGYASGSLQRITFDSDGTLNATYSNGRTDQPYRVALTIFPSQWGLDKIGDNLYMETQHSGMGTDREPGTNGAGTIAPNSLEQSNVDLAAEFVDMIVQQRGYQANSKIITTTDSMLAEVINMKR